jgi:hypothetical protein
MAAVSDQSGKSEQGDKKSAETGYQDKPWIPRFWDGMVVSAWFPLLWRNRFSMHPSRMPMAGLMSVLAVMNSLLGLLQIAFRGRKIARTEIQGDPIFIIGHWRSGTTLLHELLVLDARHTFPTTYQCFTPNHFLVSDRVFPPLLKNLLPERRPTDNMAAGWDRPQEDEFALCNMGVRSPYLMIAFPNFAPQDQEYLALENVPAKELRRWKERFLWFLRCITVRSPKRIVLKSPPHTARIKVLLEMFPQARFVHIVRHPFAVFPSTVKLWRRLSRDQGLQVPDADTQRLEEHVYQTLLRMYDAFDRQRDLIPAGHYCEVRYEDLVQDPVAQMRRVYEELKLGEFERALPALQQYVAGQAGYKTNRFDLPPETRAEIARRWRSFFERYGYPTEA